jgi:hypothetical protein
MALLMMLMSVMTKELTYDGRLMAFPQENLQQTTHISTIPTVASGILLLVGLLNSTLVLVRMRYG